MDMEKMGAFLKALRKEQGLTQEQLGERLHVSGKTISRWETGVYMPPVEMLLALSELYGVSMNELVCGERLTAESLPARAEENLTAVMKENDLFRLEERRAYWRRKWLREHWGWLALLLVLALGIQLTGALMERTEINLLGALVAIACVMGVNNARDGYVEHHLYD